MSSVSLSQIELHAQGRMARLRSSMLTKKHLIVIILESLLLLAIKVKISE